MFFPPVPCTGFSATSGSLRRGARDTLPFTAVFTNFSLQKLQTEHCVHVSYYNPILPPVNRPKKILTEPTDFFRTASLFLANHAHDARKNPSAGRGSTFSTGRTIYNRTGCPRHRMRPAQHLFGAHLYSLCKMPANSTRLSRKSWCMCIKLSGKTRNIPTIMTKSC